MSDLADFPTIEAAPMPAASPALPATTDLKTVDLQAVALAQFGDWRADVAASRKNLSTLAVDLSIPARIAEAKTFRQRLIGTPRAEVRKVATALKSRLAQVSKAVGAEADAAVAAYDGLEPLITPQIEAAEQAIEDARIAREKAEAERIAGLKLAVDQMLAPWLDRCNEDGMTAARVDAGASKLDKQPLPAELEAVRDYWTERKNATIGQMERLRLKLAAAELEAEQAKVRAEAQRVAGIQQRIAEIQAAATGHDKASSADLAEAIQAVDALAITEAIYAEFLPLAQAAQANTALTLGRLYDEAVAREQREAEEAAERARPAAIAALPPAPPPRCELSDPGVTIPDAQEGVAENPLQLEPVADMTAGDLAADGAGVEAVPPADDAPAAGRVILVKPDANAIWKAVLLGDSTQQLPAGVPLIRGEVGTIDTGLAIVGSPPFSAAMPADDAPLETSEADAQPWTPSPFYDTLAASVTLDPRDEFVALVMTAFDCKFPSHPKPSQEWWAKVRAAGEALQVR